MAIAYFDPKIARGSDCGSYMGAQFRYIGEVCTSVLFINLARAGARLQYS